LGILLAITSGRAVVSAGSGGPWRVRYQLEFSALRWTTIGLTAVLVAIGSGWDRGTLINTIIALWIIVYGVPYIAASIRFARIIRASAAEIVERRQRLRPRLNEPHDSSPSMEEVTPSEVTPSEVTPSEQGSATGEEEERTSE
jgi:hypothetical protein